MIDVVGVSDGMPEAGRSALGSATVVAAGPRLLADTVASRPPSARTITLGGDLGPALHEIAAALSDGERICVLASGDPGWFGIVRALGQRFGPATLRVHPAPSAVSLAFGRLGLAWDDAVVVSAHGRPAGDAARLAACRPKVAVLTGPHAPAAQIGRLLTELGAVHEHVAVCERLGTATERVTRTDLGGLSAGRWDDLAVVALWSGTGVAEGKSLAWGCPEDIYAHRGSMITKSEVRAAVLGRLDLPPPGFSVLWDLGAGSGSVAVECARLAPWMDVVAVDRDPDAAAHCRANAVTHRVAVRVIEADAMSCLERLPDPDRVFVGGGGTDVLGAALERLRPGGTIVATYAAIDRASAAADLLGHLSQVQANRGHRLPDGGWRLEAANPTFICWGSR